MLKREQYAVGLLLPFRIYSFVPALPPAMRISR